MCAVKAALSSEFPNILLNDIKPLPEDSLALAQDLYETSLTRRGGRKQLKKWEEIESAVTNVVILTESEAEAGMDCLSAIRQRLSERAATPAALGAMYARSLRPSAGAMVTPTTDGGTAVARAGEAEDFGWLKRTMLFASTLDMETEGLFASLQHYVGWKFLHTTLPTFNEAGAIVEGPAYIEHVPILISRFPTRPAHGSMCRALFMALQRTLGVRNAAPELRRMRAQGSETYIRSRLMAHQVSLLVITGFASEHLQVDLPEVWSLLKQLANDGVIIALHGSPAMQLQTTRPEFAELFPQAPFTMGVYDRENFAGIAKAYWDLLQIPTPMPDTLVDICEKVRGLRGPFRRVILLINQRVNRYHLALKTVIKDVEALVDEACAGLYSVVLDELKLLDDLNYKLTPERCRALIDYLPYDVSFDIMSRYPVDPVVSRTPSRRKQVEYDE